LPLGVSGPLQFLDATSLRGLLFSWDCVLQTSGAFCLSSHALCSFYTSAFTFCSVLHGRLLSTTVNVL